MDTHPKQYNEMICCACGEPIGECSCQQDDDEFFWDDDDYSPCMCQYCLCGMPVMGGGVCRDCELGAHQG